ESLGNERMTFRARQRALESARRGIVSMDRAVAKVADQEIAAEVPEGGWRQCQAPWRIQLALAHQSFDAYAICGKDVDETESGASDVVVIGRIPFCISDVQIAVDGADIERRETIWNIRIAERSTKMS